MTLGASLLLVAIGAILRYAVTVRVTWIDLHAAGVVLMVVGVVGLLIEIYVVLLDRDRDTPAL